jgi:hypothetical protein
MIALLLLAALPPLDVDLERVSSDPIGEGALAVLPLSTRTLDWGSGFRVTSAVHLDGDLRRGIPMNLSVPVGLYGASFVIHLPWVLKIDDPLASSAMGNFGLSFNTPVLDVPDFRLAVLTDISFDTTSSNGARALAFTFDIPRYAPNTHTFSVGAGSIFGLSGVVAGANAGGALHVNADPLGPNTNDGSFWFEAWAGAPLLIQQLNKQPVWVSPLLEANATSTWSWRGAVTDVAFTAGLGFSVASREFSASYDHRHRTAMSVGYQIGISDGRRVDRLIFAFDLSILVEHAEYRQLGSEAN